MGTDRSAKASGAQAFVETWGKVWRGRDSDPQPYMTLLHEGGVLVNPLGRGTREDLPQIMAGFLAQVPDVRVVPTRWAEAADGSVLIEWVGRGTKHGAPFELHGVDRFSFRDGKAFEGYSYFDPRPFLGAK
jgi:SnoaL-like domain